MSNRQCPFYGDLMCYLALEDEKEDKNDD